MESKIPLETLLHFLGTQQSEQAAETIRRRDSPDLLPADLGNKAADYYYGRLEEEGPQSLAHYGILMVELGNYYQQLGMENESLVDYFRAWNAFVDPDCRGHDVDADQLVEEIPRLKEIPTVKRHYDQR
ncbi:MAG: hypothetical protein EPN86_03825 [Nanoarchaeota archaeon]|nr:MAG: hypothetical protein EPN86_03825 [Nanoarchaeota archaeon]